MANVEKHTTAKNEYQNRSAFMSDHSKGYGVERHTRVTSLAENGRYISGRKNDDSAIKTGKTSAVTHVKRQAAEKFIGGKMQKAHYGESEPNAAASLTSAANTDNGSSQHYLQSGNNKSENPEQSTAKSEKAAELKRQLERKVAISEIESKKETSMGDTKYINKQEETTNDRTDVKTDNRNTEGEKEKYHKYFSYKQTQIENKYKKKIYRVNKRMDKLNSGKSKLNNFTTLRKLAILKQDIVRPIKDGNAIGAAAVPAKIYLKKLLEKTKLGRFAVRSKEASGRIISAAKNAEDTSQTMYAAAKKASDEVVKGVGSSIERKVRKAHEKNKYLSSVKKAERAENRANKYLSKSLKEIKESKAEVASGNVSAKLMKKVDNFSEKKNSAKKQQKAEMRNKKLEKKIQSQYKRKNEIFKNKFKKKSRAKLFAAIGGSVLSFMPVLLIIILIVPIANLILFPFSYTSKDGKEEEVKDSEFPNTILHYYEIMDEVVDKFNAKIDKFLHETSKYDNTGVVNPTEYAQWESDYQDWQEQTDAFNAACLDGDAYNAYVEQYGNELPSLFPPEEDYWYSNEELSSLGMKRGPIFEGFEWDDESDAKRVPKGELYDEMLCTISTYNTKLMSRPETVITGNDEDDTEAGEDSDVEDTPSSSGNGDIIFMNDENVAAVYGGSDFWEFKYWEEGVECPSGGECCSISVQVAHYDEKGNFTGYTEEEEKYCPTHYVIMWGVWLDFDLDRIWESYNFDEEDEENYEEVKKEFDEEKKNAEKDGFSFSH